MQYLLNCPAHWSRSCALDRGYNPCEYHQTKLQRRSGINLDFCGLCSEPEEFIHVLYERFGLNKRRGTCAVMYGSNIRSRVAWDCLWELIVYIFKEFTWRLKLNLYIACVIIRGACSRTTTVTTIGIFLGQF